MAKTITGNYLHNKSSFKTWLIEFLYIHKKIKYISIVWKGIDFEIGERTINNMLGYLAEFSFIEPINFDNITKETEIKLIEGSKKDQSLQDFLKEQGLNGLGVENEDDKEGIEKRN